MRLTGTSNYFEDFHVGDVFHHARGRTVIEADNYYFTLLSLNTAQGHVNVEYARDLFTGYRDVLVNGSFTTALALGLSTHDMAENAIADVGINGVKILAPMLPGDTLYARSTVIAKVDSDERDDCGLLTYRVDGFTRTSGDAGERAVIEAERTVLLKRRAEWSSFDDQFGSMPGLDSGGVPRD